MIELEGGVIPGKPVEALSARRRILSGHLTPLLRNMKALGPKL